MCRRYPFAACSLIFQFTPLREGRRRFFTSKNVTISISIHAPAGGATRYVLRRAGRALFQFTPLREGRHTQNVIFILCVVFQFTPLREGRQHQHQPHHLQQRISIHAPAGGATASCRRYAAGNLFQFTPLREGRHAVRRRPDVSSAYFNSRPCGRGDRQCVGRPALCPISIHAPAGGATYPDTFERQRKVISIHAPAGGATPPVGAVTLRLQFQFTPLREGRPRRPRRPKHTAKYFNSRPCGRGDAKGIAEVTKYATNFNSRPCGRGDIRHPREQLKQQNFNSRPCGRGDISESRKRHH